MFPINSPRLRRFEAWLWDRPKTAIAFALISFVLISSPAWFSDVWSLFSNDAPVPTIMNWIRSLPAISVSWYWLPVGLGAAMLVILMSVFWRERKRLEAELARAKSLASSNSAVYLHADCEKKIAQLTDDARANFARADLRDEEIKQLKAKYAAAMELADYQAAKLGDFVEVIRVCVYDAKLEEAMPTLKWGILLKNRSMFRINLDADVGSLFFEDQRLTAEKEIIGNELQGLWPDREGSISFSQRLTDAEAGLIRRVPHGKFQFDRLRISVKGGPGAEHVKSSGVLIFPEFRTKLGKCSDKETQSTEPLQARIDELTLQKSRLQFEIDEKQTRVEYRGYTTDSRLIAAKVRLRCSRVGDCKFAVRGFHAIVCEADEGTESIFAVGKVTHAYVDDSTKKRVDIELGWIVDEPLTDHRVYDFMFHIPNSSTGYLNSREHFVRVTMDAIGQEPQHIDLFVESWRDALGHSNSGITLRSAVRAHHGQD